MKVNFFAPMNRLGFGVHSYNLIGAFEKLGHEIVLVPPFGDVGILDERIRRWLEAREKFSPRDPSVMIFHEAFLPNFSGAPRIGFPVFELEKFTSVQSAGLASCDHLLTPSEWGRRILAENGFDRVLVVPEGFDPEIFQFSDKSEAEERNFPFTFAHVGKFEERKGTIQLVRCFFRALEGERARLLLQVHNPFIRDYSELQREIEMLGFKAVNRENGLCLAWRRMGLTIEIFKPVETQSQLFREIYRQADCGLFPSRAEGWNLSLLECLACGIPCIAGYWTGQTEYLKRESFLVVPEKLADRKPAADGMWFNGSRGNWNVVRDEVLIKTILRAFEHARNERKTESWRKETERIRGFTWLNAALRLESALAEIIG